MKAMEHVRERVVAAIENDENFRERVASAMKTIENMRHRVATAMKFLSEGDKRMAAAWIAAAITVLVALAEITFRALD